jgi:AcrR family transcriptional regulator
MAYLEVKKELDGRKQRTNSSRQKIVEAMLELIREGALEPKAEQVAVKAGVGLRTVFRRFNEMELLFRELSVEIQRIFMPELEKPIEGIIWQEKVLDLLERKVSIYQMIVPYRVAAKFHKHTSEFIRQDIAYWNKLEKKVLKDILPINEATDLTIFNAINGCMSFDYWLTLTTAQGLTSEEATDTIKVTVKTLIADL